jgi:hypothetical protein
MKDAAVLAILLTALAAPAAHAQTANSRVQQTRATPSTTQVKPVPAATGVNPAIRATTAPQVSSYRAATKQTLPANLFKMEDRAIIIVGGKQVVAGDVKRQLLSELRQTSGPVTFARTVSRVNTQPVRDVPGGVGYIKPKGRSPQDRITATGGIAGASVAGPGLERLANKPALSYTEMKNYCKTHPIEISRVRGTITPNGRFTIEGICFGDQTGAVDVIGQFPGGHMRLLFDSWNDVEIKVYVPPVSGATDHAISVTVVRLPDNVRSAAAQANFIATREIVAVPARYWTPNADFLQIDVDQGGGNIFGGFTVWGSGPPEARLAPFSLHVNPACALDSAGASARTGQVLAFTGWEEGPPYQANVNVAWVPRCVIQTTNYIVATSSQRICSVDFSLSAQASCPVGVAP